ncbi:MATH domain and coiled-coil domain-containing protein At3g58270-like [Cornus florida]|uniref:MATH domain and coiled-coil domain-containing protein At3g58270-like n=1 Tax=Cornus florida TaxID=4283 RepID=UPI0028999D25|nr:MATH domain and coiled-coil domain-containing protein At3g58270-like [Cornus florida]
MEAKTDNTVRLTWTIENFTRLNTKSVYSESFYVGGYKWRVLIYPKGNKNSDHFAIYLDVADSETLPYGWTKHIKFSVSVINHIDNKTTVKKDAQHQFHAQESDWGFTSFLPLSELSDPSRGYIVNDTCVVEVDFHGFRSVELKVEAAKTASVQVPEVELLRSTPMGALLESSSFDDLDAYTSKLLSEVETDGPSIPQSTIEEAKKFFIKMLSQDLSEIPDFAAHLTESICVLSQCCDLTPAQLGQLNTLKIEFPTLLKSLMKSKIAEKQGTKKCVVGQVKINAFTFQMQRAIHKDLIAKEAELQQELAKISEKKKSVEKEIKQLHGKMVNLEQSRSLCS